MHVKRIIRPNPTPYGFDEENTIIQYTFHEKYKGLVVKELESKFKNVKQYLRKDNIFKYIVQEDYSKIFDKQKTKENQRVSTVGAVKHAYANGNMDK